MTISERCSLIVVWQRELTKDIKGSAKCIWAEETNHANREQKKKRLEQGFPNFLGN